LAYSREFTLPMAAVGDHELPHRIENSLLSGVASSMRIRDLKVTTRSVTALKPYAGNAHTHSKKQIRQIAASIRTFGWTNPILTDANGVVVAGHGRLQAAIALGIDRVPTICISDMTETQKRAYVLADNKLADNAGWDHGQLAVELQSLLKLDPEFDITVTGFEMGEIDFLVADSDQEDDEADQLPEIDPHQPKITQPGDLWQLGPHRLHCADSTQAASFEKLMGLEQAQLVITDPPFNVPIQGHVSGLGSTKHTAFAMASGEMTEAEYTGFLTVVLGFLASCSCDGAINYIFMDWRHLYELLTAGRKIFSELKNLCVWTKTNGGMGSFYRSQHELVAVFKKGTAPHINNIELGRFGRNRTNVWTYAGMNSFGAERAEALSMHPTVKPVRLLEDAILDCSNRGGLVLDAFVGSGTTLIAAERTGRRGFGIEYEPLYVDIALHRFHKLTGIEPLHLESGLTFKELAKARLRWKSQPTGKSPGQKRACRMHDSRRSSRS
jgi:DNA modification methylase